MLAARMESVRFCLHLSAISCKNTDSLGSVCPDPEKTLQSAARGGAGYGSQVYINHRYVSLAISVLVTLRFYASEFLF